MQATLIEHEPAIRFAAFIGVLGLMAGLEAALPRRRRGLGRLLLQPFLLSGPERRR